jgi:uncharacterized protein
MGAAPEQNQLLDALAGRLRELAPALLAVSGGLDSRLLAFLARTWGLAFELVLFQGPHLPRTETIQAALWLHRLGLPYRILDADVMDAPQVAGNTLERCYFCKRELFAQAQAIAGGRTLMDGTNADDAASFRPGIRALKELGVRSPYAELGITKDQVRSLAAAVGLDFPDQPSRACLLTRFAYDLPPDEDTLERLALAEDQLAALGLENFRLRVPCADTYSLQLDIREKAFLTHHQQEIHTILTHFGFFPYTLLWSENVSGLYDGAER